MNQQLMINEMMIMEQELVAIEKILGLSKTEFKVLELLLEADLNSMVPSISEDIDFEDIKDNEFYDDYKRDEKIWDIEKNILEKIRGDTNATKASP